MGLRKKKLNLILETIRQSDPISRVASCGRGNENFTNYRCLWSRMVTIAVANYFVWASRPKLIIGWSWNFTGCLIDIYPIGFIEMVIMESNMPPNSDHELCIEFCDGLYWNLHVKSQAAWKYFFESIDWNQISWAVSSSLQGNENLFWWS